MWARLDDALYRNPKIRGAWNECPASIGLYALALSWAADNETDGFVEDQFVAQHFHSARVSHRAVQALASARLWLPAVHGYAIHDFLDYNPSRRELEERRDRERSRKKSPGKSSIHDRFRAESARKPGYGEPSSSDEKTAELDAGAQAALVLP